jgi:hypothetical protein
LLTVTPIVHLPCGEQRAFIPMAAPQIHGITHNPDQ